MIKVVDLELTITRAARPSAIVRARGESGAIGLGEATPLPGRSRDTVEDCARAVAAVRGVLPIALTPANALGYAADLAGAVAATAPAARFAIETALCDLVARTAGWPLARLLAPSPAASVPINALCASPAEAAAAIARGIGCVKIKQVAIARAVRSVIGDASLRVDANQAWAARDVDKNLAELAAIGVEYVEEPARGWRAKSAVPLALDESLADDDRDAWLDDALASGAFAAVVLKPALIGGLTAALALAARARAHGVDAVVTHSFDGAIATAAACELARAIGSMTRGGGPRAHGLDRPDLAGQVPQLGANVARDSGRAGLGIAAIAPRAAALEVSP
jgi:L-alanine-DL-glutamate epimerase-like enolase superfamily enzyme